MRSLPIFLDCRDRPVILLGDGEAAAAKRRLLERAGARIVGEDDEADLAVVAIADDEEAKEAVRRLKARSILVNAADRPEFCDFTLPAIVDRDPVLIAIATGGTSAGLAKALRQRLEALLPTDLGRLAQALYAAREAIRARWPHADARRRAIDGALAEHGPLDPLRSSRANPRDVSWGERVSTALDTNGAGEAYRKAAEIILIQLRSSDPDDLTLREARLLGSADRIYHRPDAPAAILDRARADAARIPCDAAPAQPGKGLSIDLGWAT